MESSDPQSTASPNEGVLRRGHFHWPTFAADAVLVTGGALVANIFNYTFHFVLSRRLEPAGYGSLATMLAISLMAGVAGSSIGTIAMQETARLWAFHRDDAIRSFGRRMLRSAAAVGAVVGLSVLALSFPLSRYLHISDRLAWWELAFAIFIGVVAAYARGAVQGAHRFAAYGASLVGEAIVKLGAAVVLVGAGFALAGAVGGVALGIAVGATVALASLLAGRPAAGGGEPRQALVGIPALRVTIIYATSVGLTLVDTIFAKHGLAARDAGYYNAAGTVARIIPYGVGLLVPLITPKAVAARHTNRAALAHLLAVTFGAAIAGSAAVLGAMELWPNAIIAVTFGAKFAPAAPMLRLYAVDTSLIALGLLGYTYLAAVGEYYVAGWLVAALAIEAGSMALWGNTPWRLIGIAIVVNALVLPAVATFVVRSLRYAPQAPNPPLAEGHVPIP
jgi:O-antigen/teichoic acid export membrane protein